MSYSNYETTCAANVVLNKQHLHDYDVEAKTIQYLETLSISASIDRLADLFERIIYNEIKRDIDLNKDSFATKIAMYGLNNIQYKEIANEYVFEKLCNRICIPDEVVTMCM